MQRDCQPQHSHDKTTQIRERVVEGLNGDIEKGFVVGIDKLKRGKLVMVQIVFLKIKHDKKDESKKIFFLKFNWVYKVASNNWIEIRKCVSWFREFDFGVERWEWRWKIFHEGETSVSRGMARGEEWRFRRGKCVFCWGNSHFSPWMCNK